MNPTSPNINTSPKSIDLMQNTSPLLNNYLPNLQLSYKEYRYLKEVLENFRFCRTSGNEAYDRGCWGHLVCIIMTHCVRKSICDSPLSSRALRK